MKNLRNTIVAALLGVAFLAGCADGPLSPDADVRLTQAEGRPGSGGAVPDIGDYLGDSGPTVFLYWLEPLAQDITVTQWCEAQKPCDLYIEEADAQLVIPRNALTTSMSISMTAVAGAEVNFVFGPHGTEFDGNVKIKVGQERTTGVGLDFTAYYWTDDLNTIVDEIEATLKNGKIEFYTDHFSGYALGM